MNKKVLLEAPILTQSGYGEHSRLVFKALKTNPDLDVYIMPLGWGSTSWVQNFDPEIEECIKKCHQYIAYCNQNKVQNAFDAQIRVGIPNEFEKKAPYSVVVSAGIETDRVSWSWILKTHEGQIRGKKLPNRQKAKQFEGKSGKNRQRSRKSEGKSGKKSRLIMYFSFVGQ